ncbi:histone-lysine N-methyltransferase SETMAR [Trichonephila clavipes]|nr:histone-lysine N-methyltransferase SETMAR [Trichonephila clavipes]
MPECTTFEHPPFLPYLDPSDFFLLPRLKLALKGKRFDDIPDIQRNVSRFLNSIPPPKKYFLQSFQDMYSRFQRCIVMGGDYFEGHCVTRDVATVIIDGSEVTNVGTSIIDNVEYPLWHVAYDRRKCCADDALCSVSSLAEPFPTILVKIDIRVTKMS